MRPRALMQNQHTRELVSAQNTQVQQRPKSPTVTLTWHVCKYKVHKLHQRYTFYIVTSEEAHPLHQGT